MRHGFALPVALNNGQQVDLMLARIGALYGDLSTFDSLPTPFRSVAMDLRTSEAVVLDSGFLTTAMRATMSLPGIFPPIETGPWVLVDGGPMNNVPADVVRTMGADIVIAVTVGSNADTSSISYSVFGLVNNTTAAMMRANTRRAIASADIVVHPRVQTFSSLDWRKGRELEEAGYAAAEAARAQLLPLAVDDATWHRYMTVRAARHRTRMPVIAKVEIEGAVAGDEHLMYHRLLHQLGRALDIPALQNDINRLSGLDRYLAIEWFLVQTDPGVYTLLIRAVPRRSAPPILMLGFNAQNQTSQEFALQIAARFLAFDVLMPRSELRVDAALGTSPRIGAELREAFGGSMFFTAATIGAAGSRINFTNNTDAIIAQYGQSLAFGQLDFGFTPGEHAEFRIGTEAGYYSARVKVGDPGLPSLSGPQSQLVASAIYDDQDSPVVPSGGLRVVGTAGHVMSTPRIRDTLVISRSNLGLTQAELTGSYFWSWNEKVERLFVVSGVGSSFGGLPLPTDQFVLGLPFRLDAFSIGERRGDDVATLTGGYLHVIGRLPDFLGGPILVGAWAETGSAFDRQSTSAIEAQFGVGAILDTFLGPALVSYSLGSTERRLHVGFGRLWR
jgi:NTE family protein